MPNGSNQKDIIWKPSKHLPIRYPKTNCKAKKSICFWSTFIPTHTRKNNRLESVSFQGSDTLSCIKKIFLSIYCIIRPIKPLWKTFVYLPSIFLSQSGGWRDQIYKSLKAADIKRI